MIVITSVDEANSLIEAVLEAVNVYLEGIQNAETAHDSMEVTAELLESVAGIIELYSGEPPEGSVH